MTTEEKIPSRIRRPKEREQTFQQLVEQEKVFPTFRELMVFAAALGFARGRRVPFEKAFDPIPWNVFQGGQGEFVMNFITASTDDDFTALGNSRLAERVLAFEEYANGGLELLQSRIAQDSMNPPVMAVRRVLIDAMQDADAGSDAPDTRDLLKDIGI